MGAKKSRLSHAASKEFEDPADDDEAVTGIAYKKNANNENEPQSDLPSESQNSEKQEEKTEKIGNRKDDTPDVSPAKQIMERTTSTTAKDLMISYSHKNKDMMQKLKDNLEANGISVWVDTGLAPGADFLKVIGSAIINAKIFIPLLSSDSVTSKWCKDEVALAFISKGSIFPVALEERKHLHTLMETDMKVELDTFKWTFILDPDLFDTVFQNLVTKIKAEIAMIIEHEKSEKQETFSKKAPMLRAKTQFNLIGNYAEENEEDALVNMDPEEYWNTRFSDDEINFQEYMQQNMGDNNHSTQLSQASATGPPRRMAPVHSDACPMSTNDQWYTTTRHLYGNESFFIIFQNDFKEKIDEMYSTDDRKLMEEVFIREMEIDNDDILYKEKYIYFCTVEEKLCPLWQRLQEELLQSLAMRKVFDTDSYYRVQAIDNLSSFQSSAVVEALRDLLVDKKPNVRAVATVSLAKTGVKDKLTCRRVMKCLNDKDRLVRQAGCLALGHMKAEAAVPQLLELWRNDIISSVRAAAEVALKQIGGPAVEKDMQFTDMLEKEIEELSACID